MVNIPFAQRLIESLDVCNSIDMKQAISNFLPQLERHGQISIKKSDYSQPNLLIKCLKKKGYQTSLENNTLNISSFNNIYISNA